MRTASWLFWISLSLLLATVLTLSACTFTLIRYETHQHEACEESVEDVLKRSPATKNVCS